ncbi:MAG: prohibitin family protein [Oscillospiraceae bacterium]|nr:prohibitin family protein [Oscillospiraceae bacterium]
MNKKIGKLIAIAAIIVIILIVGLSSMRSIPTGHVGVVVQLGAPTGRVVPNGLQFSAPLVQHFQVVDTRVQTVEAYATAVSSDLQSVDAIIVLNYQITSAGALYVVQNIGTAFLQGDIIVPALQQAVKDVTARYTSSQLVHYRARIATDMLSQLEEELAEFGVIVRAFNIVDFQFSDIFDEAIEQAQAAEQDLVRIEAEERARVVRAQARLAAAEYDAAAILVAAEAEAAANRLIADSITDRLVDWEIAQSWDGQLPQVQGGGTPIIDLRP